MASPVKTEPGFALADECAYVDLRDKEAVLTEAIAEGEAVLALTIADAERVDAADQRLKDILVKVGRYQPEEEPSKLAPYVEKAAENFSLFLLKTLGGGRLFDKIFR